MVLGWQGHGKAGASLGAVFGLHGASVQLDEMPNDREPESGPSWAGASLVHSVEPLEDAGEVRRWNSWTGVGDHDLHPPVASACFESYGRALRRVVDGVLDQIADDVVE